jgi:guanyl-specific ribonuclease Sa
MWRRLALLALGWAVVTGAAQKRERLRDEESRAEGAAAVGRAMSTLKKEVRLPSGELVDLTATLRRIADQRTLRDAGLPPHDGDGTVFLNLTDREAGRRPLPSAPRGYYTEYVHPPPPGVRWPGPQRVIVGRKGEVYFSPDHYRAASIIPLHGAPR